MFIFVYYKSPGGYPPEFHRNSTGNPPEMIPEKGRNLLSFGVWSYSSTCFPTCLNFCIMGYPVLILQPKNLVSLTTCLSIHKYQKFNLTVALNRFFFPSPSHPQKLLRHQFRGYQKTRFSLFLLFFCLYEKALIVALKSNSVI